MVYIPWAEKGICKFHMLQRCYSRENCKWRHPEPEERSRLWDYYAEQQRLDEEKGIPPPKNPLKQPSATDARRGETSRSGPDRPTPSPPVSPPPPPNTPKKSGAANKDIDKNRDPRLLKRPPAPLNGESAETRGEDLGPHMSRDAAKLQRVGTPPAKAVPTEHQVGVTRRDASNVSMLDAPPSPKNDHGEDSLTDVNAKPLGRPNRVGQSKNNEVPSKGRSKLSGTRKTRFDCKTTKYRYVAISESLLSREVPSPAAVTLWKRGEGDATNDNAHMTTGTKVSPPRQGGYWEKLRERKAVLSGVKKEESNAAADDAGRHVKPTKSRDTASHLTLIPRQISRRKVSSSSPLTNPPLLAMGATKRLANGETKHVGPHPSTIRVSTQYMSQAAISKKLQQSTSQLDIQERSIAEAREDTIRLQGVGWIDSVRRSLQLPIRTYTTACVYFHKFRLAHAGNLNDLNLGNAWPDACAASLLTSCKVEDTLKKSRDILAAAYNLKSTTHEQLGADDSVFEGPSRVVIGLERLVLEAGGFDFRSKYPHRLMVKLAKSMPEGEDGEREKVAKTSWSVLTDLYRTFAPLKQTSVTMALASLELAAHLVASSGPNNISAVRDALRQVDLKAWSTSREEIMETVLDLLDLYTQHTSHSILGPKYSLDDFLRIRLAFNKECNESNIPRYTAAPPSDRAANGSTLRVTNGHPTPVSPMEPGPQAQPQTQNADGSQTVPEGGGTLRFMLNPHLAADEKAQVQKYFVEEWEEYEEEVEIPQPRQPSREREPARSRDRERASSDRPRDTAPPRADRSERSGVRGREDRDRTRERDRPIERDREPERERPRPRDADRDGRFAGRRYDDRDRRYDDERDRRYEGRRYEDDRRRDRR